MEGHLAIIPARSSLIMQANGTHTPRAISFEEFISARWRSTPTSGVSKTPSLRAPSKSHDNGGISHKRTKEEALTSVRGLGLIPIDRLPQPIVETNASLKTEKFPGFFGVQHSAGLSVWLRRIPYDFASKTG